MFEELYAPLYAELPDGKAYLERIGMESVKKLDKETLDALVLAHLRTVPFENLDVFDADREVFIGIPPLYDKVVVKRRGGYCFELNAIFMALLESLGFKCHAVAVRVVWNASTYMPLTHRATIVTLGGERYFCDVGFGGPSPQGALRFDYGIPQDFGAGSFVVEKEGQGTVIYRLLNGGERERTLMFAETPVDPVDFLALNEYQSRSKYSGFRMMRMLNLVTETGSKTLNANVFRIHDSGNTAERILTSEAEIKQVLKEHFNLEVDFPLKMV